MMKSSMMVLCCVLALLGFHSVRGQSVGTIMGSVRDGATQEALAGATVRLEGTTLGAYSNALGSYTVRNVPARSYTIIVSLVGYRQRTLYNVVLTSGNVVNLNVDMEEQTTASGDVVITANTFGKIAETPLSVQSLTTEEIRSNPGGNFDISRAAQALPGIGGATGGASFRNDITVRGGGPSENVYYLDGIEIPQINHFATQGSAGGPAGILNVAFIEELNISSSSFGARYDNALSSVFSVRQKDGNAERLQANVRVSATEVAATADGPLWNGTTAIASVRRSYLDLLFTAIDLPIRPNYWDFQFKTTTRLNPATTITTLGVGAIDEFRFGIPRESTPEKEYTLRSVPSINQWNYTVGAMLKHTMGDALLSASASRNVFDNRLDQFEDARTGDEARRTLGVTSRETENKLRAEYSVVKPGLSYTAGAQMQYVEYGNTTFMRITGEIRDSVGNVVRPAIAARFASAVDFMKYGVYGNISGRWLDDRLTVTAGIRADANSFTDGGTNLLRTLSPRMSVSYGLSDLWRINATVGRYYKIPSYTILGFGDAAGNYVNRGSGYIGTTHAVLGAEFLPEPSVRVTAEVFLKTYDGYPVSVADGISLANKGTNFGSVGSEAVQSIGRGRTYGAEVFFQKKLTEQFFATVSYTFMYSQFTGADGMVYIPSAWDYRHLVSAIVGYKFAEGWEFGMKYRLAGGSPYTPFDLAASQRNYATTGTGTLDYGQLNTLRLRPFQQADVRVDRKFSFDGWALDLFIDVQNVLGFANDAAPEYTFRRLADNSGWETTDGRALAPDGSNATPVILGNGSTLVTPSIGIIVEF